jgi:glucose/arabinose dehydrogenase
MLTPFRRLPVKGSLVRSPVAFVVLTLILVVAAGSAQQGRREGEVTPLSSQPQTLGTAEQRFRVVPLTGLTYPWALAFLPNSDVLVTERPGRLRIVHDFVLDPRPISGIPPVLVTPFQGLWDVAIHPRFAENKLVYFTYAKANPNETVPSEAQGTLQGPSGMAVLARGRFDGDHALTEVRDLFVSNIPISGATAARIVFAPDGKIFMSIGSPSRDQAHGGPNRIGTAEAAQDPGSDGGKILRLNDDGTIPADNPFLGKSGYRPEIYALGFRNPLGLIVHPQTGELMDAEHGPQGGDEVNVVSAGKNYGWPVISMGRAYAGNLTQGGSGPELAEPCAPGMEQPFIFWVPSIMPGGLTVYTGTKFPAWTRSVFVGGLQSKQLHRVTMNNRGMPTRRESLLTELKQRIREVRQGPDGLLYLLTDHEAGALLKLEPVPEGSVQ